MSTYQDPYHEPRRVDPVMAGLTVTLFIMLGATVFLAFLTRDKGAQLDATKAQLAAVETDLAATKKEAERAKAEHEANLKRINADWETQIKTVQEANDERLTQGMASVAKVVDEVVNNSGAAVGYLQQLEAKVRSGQQLQRAEVDKLRGMASGLAYLNKQYEKPLDEFKELDSYVSSQLQLPSTTSPEEKGKLFRRLFSPGYREQQKTQLAEFYEDQGRREALTGMQTKVVESYSQAQSQMAAIGVDQKKYLDSLEAIVNGKQGDIQSMESFFEVSGKILNIHQKMMAIEPPPVDPLANQTPRP